MSEDVPRRDEIWSRYLDQLPYEPYPVQEQALLDWFESDQGVLVCAPTGTGKTLIAEAAMFEALHTGKVAYYTTPLIALTEQKFDELQNLAGHWGFHPDDVGLVTGNRCVNPDAKVLVVVAEILLNRLLHPEAFNFEDVSAVVMDEFHSFADPERGIVWELSLGLLPKHVRLLLLSATVGNAPEFLVWLHKSHSRKVRLVQGNERRVPLRYHWIEDQLLNEQIEVMASGDDATRKTPALVFCFNRDQCWSVAEQLRGKSLLAPGQQKQLAALLDEHDWSQGVGPKLKTILLRGVGVHHAGLLPKYRRIVERLFQKKLLSVAVCTETLAAGINLPARSVLITTLIKGPKGKKKVIDASSAHQMFGRAGRPQFDDEGHVFAIAHEDDVKIARWKEKHDTIPEDTKDPNLIKARKRILKKMPTRRKTEQYWNEAQFQKLIESPPGKLSSRGPMPWRLLAYLLRISPDVSRLRDFLHNRLMSPKQREAGEKRLRQMLMTLWAGGFVTLDPPPPQPEPAPGEAASKQPGESTPESQADSPPESASASAGLLGSLIQEAREDATDTTTEESGKKKKKTLSAAGRILAGDALARGKEPEEYEPRTATPTDKLDHLLIFRSVNPVYGAFLISKLGIADFDERVQALESVLEMTFTVARDLKVPPVEQLPPGPLATTYLDQELVSRGLVTAEQLGPKTGDERTWEERWTPTVAEKLRMLFDSEFPGVQDFRTQPVWAAGELLRFEGDFNKMITARKLAKQEGIVFRHVLRMILLCGEFSQISPPEVPLEEWQAELRDIADRLTAACRVVDPDSTDKAIEQAQAIADIAADVPPPAK